MKFQKSIPVLLISALGLAGCGHDGPAYHDESYYKSHPKQEKKVEEYCQKHHDLSRREVRNCQEVRFAIQVAANQAAEKAMYGNSKNKKPGVVAAGGVQSTLSKVMSQY
ncbi:EexN family lipoprotein [Acidithiobacillus caldus]|uniref:EexN family lipoprotein n=1 Tax=Acidithiobacillus caldus TaxID=33059 RepID=UPI00155DD059|nr:EexN family lipoprotein [Acidithiobacillus caldus]MBU2822218.1 EexN family lipoprotein [Acidithiobacillus caldus]